MKKISFLTILLLAGYLACNAPKVQAQRNVPYQKLSIGDQRPSQFFDFLVLPGKTGETVDFTSVFSFSYRYLPFRKLNRPGSESGGRSFYSPVNLSMEVFNSTEDQLKKSAGNISEERLEPAGRSFWEDTAFAKTYEQTQSELTFLYGNIGVELKPGIYTYVLQMKRGERSDPKMSRKQTVRVEPYREMKVGNVILGEELYHEPGKESQLKLMSMGNNVKYGSDFYALAYIPDYNPEGSYRVEVNTLDRSRKDTSAGEQQYSRKLASKDLKTDLRPELVSARGHVNLLQLSSDEDGFAYALIKIPNSTFPNGFYQLAVKDHNNETVSRARYQSMWIDMPRSLLSLDIAIDMLGYIVDGQTLDRLTEGSRAERERKFREFWKERDPTPETEYNELMAEYYRRIDYAYQNFSTSNSIGYESDQGEVYIKFGPPDNIERKFPPNGSTVEIWSYSNREFVFRATSGFGDFKLVSE